jgi:acyl transferase domain-containing protein/thioesterase domain-containing protein
MINDLHNIDPGSIAIVGLAGRFPAASSTSELWTMLREGREATQWMTANELREAGVPESDIDNPDYVRASMVLPKMEMFDAEFFGFSKRDAAILDPQHRHFLECAWEALEDAGHMPEQFPGAIGVFGGCGMQAYLAYNLLTNPKLVKSVGMFLLRHTGNDKDFLTTRLSYLLDLKGPSMSIQTACSTSLVAVHVASQSLLSGECDMAIAGGVSIEVPHRRGYHYAEGEILSPDGHCRAFDESANGTVFGSGAGIVVLRRLSDAIRDRDNIYAVIRGSAVNNDGSQKAGYLAPSVDGQASAAVEALAVSGVEPSSVSYIEAHGTGTPVGDPIEVAALAQAYGGGGQNFCGIGSLKTNIGHLDTAAGVASLIKVSLALRNEFIPASLNFSEPNTRFDIAKTPFFVMDQPKPWARGPKPRRAAVNSLGVGGTNAHAIVEEAPAVAAPSADAGWQLLNFSARSPESLAALKEKWRQFLVTPPSGFRLDDAAFTLQAGRKSFDHRSAVVARDLAGLREALQTKNNPRSVNGKSSASAPGVVMMFPGGGAHYPGAGRELLSQPGFRETIDECFSLISSDAPKDLRAVMFESEASDAVAAGKLEKPGYAIPALFILEYALAKLWESWGIKPAAVIGHSAGEYAAACLAGVMSVTDALSIVVLRGQLFELAPPGGMLSIDLPEAELRAMMDGLAVDMAAVNAPDLCIASGSLEALGQLEQRLGQRGLEGRRLRINVAAHSRLLDGVLGTFRERMSRIHLNAPSIPFISNLTGTWAGAKTLTDPEYWTRHLRNPVRFADGLQQLAEMPDAVLVEAGPGQGLCALAKQNSAGTARAAVPSTCKAQDPAGDLAIMLTSAGALWTRGISPSWEAMQGAALARRISLPTYAFDHKRHWIEPGIFSHEPEEARQPLLTLDAPAITRLSSYDDWFLTPTWKRSPLSRKRVDPEGKWLVFGNSASLTADVLVHAAESGSSITLVRSGDEFAQLDDGSFTISPTDAEHFGRLFGSLEQSDALPDQIVYLWALDTLQSAGRSAQAGIAGQPLSFDCLVYIAKALQELDVTKAIHLTVVTGGSQAVSGEAVPHPERALAIGPCRVIPHEMANVTARLVDFAAVNVSTNFLSRSIISECLAVHDHDLVAYRAEERWAMNLVKAAVSHDSGSNKYLRPNGVYLISGGLGDIALDLASFLANTVKARLALVSRRALPPRTLWRTLAASADRSAEVCVVRQIIACEDRGAQILVLSADVSDRKAMARVVSDCRDYFGTINGVFHAAGTLEDGPIATKSAESIQRVLHPKVMGAQVLHELLPPGDLDFFALFSSTSVYLGAPGQVDYVAANAFLDSLAASRPDGLNIHWGVWGDKGMAARAYGQHKTGPAQQKPIHPLLGVQVDVDHGTAFEATYSPAELWVLSEHSVAGRPILPGTAYIEIARAAMEILQPGQAIEICALSFGEAMVFDSLSTRVVRAELRQTEAGYDFVVRSRETTTDDWQEHARANVGFFYGVLPHLLTSGDMATAPWCKGEIPQEKAVSFGARWGNIARMQLGKQSAMAELQLPERFAGDVADYGIHPAVTDMAATFGIHLIDDAERRDNLFVPLSIDRIRIVAPLGSRAISRIDLKARTVDRLISFDVGLHAPDGSPIATFEGFSMRGVKPQIVARAARVQPKRELSLTEAMLASGITGNDSHELFTRLLSGDHRDVVISSIAFIELKRAFEHSLTSRTKKAVAHADDGKVETPESDELLNPVERVIADAWRELLGVEEIARDDDFFALGGHSLAAVRLFARIRKQFAVDLPLATLFQAPTLEALANVVSESGGLDTSQAAAVIKKISSTQVPIARVAWSPLVAICRGRTGKRPIFCVHGAGGNVLNFKVISDRLGTDQPFYGLQAQGVDGLLKPLATVEAMAAQYVDAIRSVDPVGPYRLAGYSGGGVIAFEMAQQLTRNGASVEMVAMIDTLSPDAAAKKISLPEKIWLMRHWTFKFAIEWPQRYRTQKKVRISDEITRQRLLQGEKLTPDLLEFYLFGAFVDAQSKYKLRTYSGSVVLFRACEAYTPYLSAGAKLGWQVHVEGGVRVTEVPGSHITMLAEPGLSVLMDGLKRELARLDDEANESLPRILPTDQVS